jgi:hypothetical protein
MRFIKENRRIMFRSQNPDHFVESLELNRVRKGILPGINLISLNISCDSFDESHAPADIWYQKSGVGDYLLINDNPVNPDPEKNYRINIPQGLFHQASQNVSAYDDLWKKNEDDIF